MSPIKAIIEAVHRMPLNFKLHHNISTRFIEEKNRRLDLSQMYLLSLETLPNAIWRLLGSWNKKDKDRIMGSFRRKLSPFPMFKLTERIDFGF